MDKPINGMRIKGNLIETYLHGQFPRVIYIYFFNVSFYTGVQPVNNVVIITGGQQRDSAIHIHEFILPWGDMIGSEMQKAEHMFTKTGLLLLSSPSQITSSL